MEVDPTQRTPRKSYGKPVVVELKFTDLTPQRKRRS
jgi:hypothetical protein